VFFGATAGMRLLEPEPCRILIDNARTNIKKWGFNTRDEWITVISGE